MRSILGVLVSLLLCLGFAASTRADSSPGPNPNWPEKQRLEWQLGYVAQASNICGTYDESAVLLQIARMTPYGDIGRRAVTDAAIAAPDCERFNEQARLLVADAYRIREAIQAGYRCSGKACYGQPAPTWQDHACGDTLLAHLAKRDVGLEAVGAVTYIYVGYYDISPAEYKVSIELKSCTGSLNLELKQSCRVFREYTQGDCEIAGAGGL